MKLTNKEVDVLITLIDSQQFDGAKWWLNGISLNKLKMKLKRKDR